MKFHPALRSSFLRLFAVAIVVCASPARAVTTVTVDWGETPGLTAGPFSYGLNVFQGFDPQISGTPGNAAYKANVAAMRAGLIRHHQWEMMADSATHASGWIVSPATADYRWDRARIAAALEGSFAYGPVRMMNIPAWPEYLDDGTGKLQPGKRGAFAAFCADLVRAVNVEQKRGVLYWEVTNERDDVYADDMAGLAAIYNEAALAMKAVDPTIKVGGPALARPDLTERFEAFLAVAHPHLDFVSYHSYATGDTGTENSGLWDHAAGLGWLTAAMRASVAKFTPRPVELFHNEYNLSWAPPDPRMNDEVGAVFDALALAAITTAGATGSMAWNEADGWYGKLDNDDNWTKRPAAYVFQLFNEHLRGTLIAAASDAPRTVAVYAVAGLNRKTLILINRSGSAQDVKLAFSGWAAAPGENDPLTAHRVTSAGLATTNPTLGTLTSSYPLPADSVTVLTRADAASLNRIGAVTDDTAEGWTWGGGWSHYNDGSATGGSAHGSDAAGGFGEYTFTGTGVEVVAWKGPDGGVVEVFLDGVSRGEFSQANPGGGDLYGQTLFRTTDLTPGTHTTRVVAKTLPADGWAMVDGLKILRPLPPAQSWRQTWFGTIADTAPAADTADPDHDGVCNRLERAFASSPLDPRSAGRPVGGLDPFTVAGQPGTYLVTRFPRDPANTDLVYEAQVSADLLTWQPVATSVAGGMPTGAGFVGETATGAVRTVTARDTVPVGGGSGNAARRFMRVKVSDAATP